MQDFIQAIADEHVYLFDGAMGTMLYSKGVFINKCYDELNLRSPEMVAEVHKLYVRAGGERGDGALELAATTTKGNTIYEDEFKRLMTGMRSAVPERLPPGPHQDEVKAYA